MVSTGDLVNKFTVIRANPAAMQRLVLNVQEALLGKEYTPVNVTSPFAILTECAVTAASAAMLHTETLTQRLYPDNAVTDKEIYLHMSDKDYLNRFSTPSRGIFTFLFSLDEIVAKAVPLGDGSGNRKLIIPKHTEISVGGYTFSMQYPIVINVTNTDSISVFFDISKPSPVLTLENNRVNFSFGGYGNKKIILIDVPIQQMVITSQIAQLNNVTGLHKEFSFTDKFYYCRAFIKNAVDSEWVEIKTTHSEQVYDPNTPTAVLTVLSNSVSVRIPQIYFNNGLVKDSLRVDIYTTKGSLDLNLSGFSPDSYVARWLDHDAVGDNNFTTPLYTFSGFLILTENPVTGGSNGLSFNQLRERVITNGLDNAEKPITDEQLSTTLTAMGYDVIVNLDNITDRQILALRELPPPSNKETVTGMGCTVKVLQTRLSDLVQISTVENHGERVTIRPETLFKLQNGILSVVSDSQRNTLLDSTLTPPDILANTANEGGYYYTPFHYVLDTTGNLFDTRIYKLNSPKVVSKYLFLENTAFGLNTSTATYGVDLDPSGSGYRLLVEASVSDVYSALALDQTYVQLSFIPPGSNTRVFINGTLVSPIDGSTGKPVNNKYIYSFSLATRYDIDRNHLLLLEELQSPTNLTGVFDLVYIVRNFLPPGATASDIDNVFDASVLVGYDSASIYHGFVQEKFTIKFGDYLEHMWTRSRSVVEDVKYQRYVNDVPAVYINTVYQRDSNGNIVLTYNTITEELDFTILHEAGDPILDEFGLPIFKHRAGDVILDSNGSPMPVGGSQGMLRQIDMFLVDGRYYFATNEATVSYRKEAVDLIGNWVTNDLSIMSNYLLERSEIFYHPKVTSGLIDVIVNDQQKVQISADQTFVVEYFVRQDVYENEAIRNNLEDKTATVLTESLKNITISVSEMTERLREAGGSDVLSVNVSGFAGDVYSTVTLLDSSAKPVVGKRLTALSNKTLAVQDAIVVKFVRHLPRTS